MSIKDDPQEMARVQVLNHMLGELEDYLLDHCPDDQAWEDFDPEIDALRTKVQEMLGDKP
ncbi:hypothetical protein KXR64_16440 [Brucella intermedia]|uniref:hypothetical protein n=1 Tax=Brucella TaxID=234 RepID=UPI0009461F03|nr:hypothetical protein [Brucella intermedia]